MQGQGTTRYGKQTCVQWSIVCWPMSSHQRLTKPWRKGPMRTAELVKCTSGTHAKNSVKEMMTCGIQERPPISFLVNCISAQLNCSAAVYGDRCTGSRSLCGG